MLRILFWCATGLPHKVWIYIGLLRGKASETEQLTQTSVNGANVYSLAVKVVEVWTRVKCKSFQYMPHRGGGFLCRKHRYVRR